MSLALYGHPFSYYTQKVLVALYENATPFALRSIGPDTPQHTADWQRLWPLRKFPLLLDGERSVVESSIIIGALTGVAEKKAAAPSLFYADWTHVIGAQYPWLRAYRARLLARTSFARVVDEARPYRHFFPLGAPERD